MKYLVERLDSRGFWDNDSKTWRSILFATKYMTKENVAFSNIGDSTIEAFKIIEAYNIK